ncbi:MAG: di-heme oxidoredictase family protein [Anaerolineae bacterium]
MRRFRDIPFASLAGLAFVLASCTPRPASTPPPTAAPPPTATARAGVTVDDATINAFSLPLPGLSDDERRAFFVGNAFFNDPWVTAPSSTTARDGLGPTFNATSCAGCHFKDGRGAPPTADAPDRLGLLVRLSAIDANGAFAPHPAYGDQLQDHAILGVPAEGRFDIAWEEVAGRYGDGTAYTLLHPVFTFRDPAFGPLGNVADTGAAAAGGAAATLAISPRTAPATFGLGLLEAVPEADIVARADPDDADGDGISGRPNRVPDLRTGGVSLGRFGWKAGQPTIEQQAAGAFLGDIGITSSLHPATNCPAPQTACRKAIDGGSPELADERLARIVLYDRALAVPAPRSADDPRVPAGAALFAAARCDACHVPAMRTAAAGHNAAATDDDVHAASGDVDGLPDALADQPFAPYTDLLLHDMGPGLADDRPEHEATGREWRTAPLWGVGLIPTVNKHDRLLHDGRARGIAEAILWHGGEAEAARERFRTMTAAERAALVAFVATR